jgi:hypothetical protein
VLPSGKGDPGGSAPQIAMPAPVEGAMATPMNEMAPTSAAIETGTASLAVWINEDGAGPSEGVMVITLISQVTSASIRHLMNKLWDHSS